MKSINLHIFDNDIKYLDRLEDYLLSRKDNIFSVKTHTDIKEGYITEHGINLISASLAEGCGIRLSKERTLILHDGRMAEELFEIEGLYKYQPGEAIYKRLVDMCMDIRETVPGIFYKKTKDMEITGIYSPDPLKDTYSLALELAGKEAESENVLLIDLQDFPQKCSAGGIQDLFYYLSSPGGKIGIKMQEVIFKDKGIWTVNGGGRPGDIKDIDKNTWEKLFNAIGRETDVESLIINFSGLPSDMGIFGLCDKLLIPEGDHGDKRGEAFKDMLKGMGMEGTVSRTEEIFV